MKRTFQHQAACALTLSLGLFLVGCNSSGDNDTPPDDAGAGVNPPSVPADLQASVYSSSAVELSWEASTDDGSVVDYQVYRDDSLVATQNTLRFFDNVLTAGTTHTYQVLAVDDEGNLSEPAEIIITTLDEGPAISEANVAVILPYVVATANGEPFDELVGIVKDTDGAWLSGYAVNDIAGLTLVEDAVDPTGVWHVYNYDCELGGSYDYYKDTFIQFGGYFKGEYDGCGLGSNTISGLFDHNAKVDKAPPYNQPLSSLYDLTVVNDSSGSTRTLTSTVVVDNSQVENRYHLTEGSYSESNPRWSTTISDIDIVVYATDEEPLEYFAKPFSRVFTASFRVQGPQTGDVPLTVAIDVNTDDEASADYQNGFLSVTAEDGSSLRMDLDNGDPDSVQLTFSQSGSTTASTVDWSDEYRLLCVPAPTFAAPLAACQ